MDYLPPLRLEQEIKDYEAYHENKAIDFPICYHKNCTSMKDGWLRCKCGAGWKSNTEDLMKLKSLLDK